MASKRMYTEVIDERYYLVTDGQISQEAITGKEAMSSISRSRGVACCDRPKVRSMGDGWYWCVSCGSRWKE